MNTHRMEHGKIEYPVFILDDNIRKRLARIASDFGKDSNVYKRSAKAYDEVQRRIERLNGSIALIDENKKGAYGPGDGQRKAVVRTINEICRAGVAKLTTEHTNMYRQEIVRHGTPLRKRQENPGRNLWFFDLLALEAIKPAVVEGLPDKDLARTLFDAPEGVAKALGYDLKNPKVIERALPEQGARVVKEYTRALALCDSLIEYLNTAASWTWEVAGQDQEPGVGPAALPLSKRGIRSVPRVSKDGRIRA